MHGFFAELVIILTASALVLAVFYRLRLPPTLGYLTTGLLIGPGALGLIGNQEAVQYLAEFGVVFLLFSLGLEFSLSRLLAMRRLVFGLGGGQVLICTAAFMAVGLGFGLSPPLALLMAAVLALSSTAVVTRELARSGELYARHGQLGVAVLLFQDLAAVLFLILIPALATEGDGLPLVLALTVAKGLVLFAALIGIGKWVLPRVFFEVAKTHSDELFVLAALLVALLALGAPHLAVAWLFGVPVMPPQYDLVLFVLIGLATSAQPLLFGMCRQLVDAQTAGKALAAVNLAFFLGTALMQSTTGAVAAFAGLPAVLLFMAAALFVGVLIFLAYTSPTRAIG